MPQYTNSMGINLPMAIWLCHDTYDYNPDPYYISATSLLKPIQASVLLRRNDTSNLKVDISTLIKSRTGNALHDAAERAWLDPQTRRLACKAVGISEAVADRIVVNPDLVKEGDIPVYLEKRSHKKIGKYTIGGKFDLVLNGELHDTKNTVVFYYMKNKKDNDYILQGSIYRWLNDSLITSDILTIDFKFNDWKKFETYKENYPKFPIMNEQYEMMSIADTEAWVKERIGLLDRYMHNPDLVLPQCTEKELWMDPPDWKYYSKKGADRATRNFKQDMNAAYQMLSEKGVGEVRKSEVLAKACNYCAARPFCKQAAGLQARGLIKDD